MLCIPVTISISVFLYFVGVDLELMFMYFFFLKHREIRLQQEKEQLEQKIQWLEKEIKEKTNDMLNTRKEQVCSSITLYCLANSKGILGCASL